MQNNKYIIKNLAPWMMDELIAFSQISTYEIFFLRRQSAFYDEGLHQLRDNGVIIHYKTQSIKQLWTKLNVVVLFVIKNISKFSIDYNAVIGVKSLFWFVNLDLSLFSTKSKIHAQFATQATIIALLIKRYYNNKPEYSFTFHAYDIYFKNRWFNLLVENCKNAFSISDYNIDYVKKHNINSDKITLSRLGVFRESFQVDSRNKLDFKKFTLGLISWFVEKKGIRNLLQAFLKLKQMGYADIHLILAGDGALKEEYLEFIEINQLSDSIKYIGIIKGKEKQKFFNSLDVFILPSISLNKDQDGIPVVLMEAISYGLPIISTNVSGIPEICIDKYNGRLIEEKNIDQMVEVIIDIQKNKDLLKEYSLNSLTMSKNYDILLNSRTKINTLCWN